MPKYKYVDGVKQRVVPQSVLGYALVREDSDNSLPVGGTEGQVLTKASNTDYDVEWTTVESGDCDTFIITIEGEEGGIPTEDAIEYYNKLAEGKVPIICMILDDKIDIYTPSTINSGEEGGHTFYNIDATSTKTPEPDSNFVEAFYIMVGVMDNGESFTSVDSYRFNKVVPT